MFELTFLKASDSSLKTNILLDGAITAKVEFSVMQRDTPQPLYNTVFGVQASFHVSYPNCVISRVKCIGCTR